MINLDFVYKNKLKKYFGFQFLPLFFAVVLGMLICMKNTSPPMCFVSFLILFYYSYLIHYFIHKIPDNINLHILYHHNKGKPKIINFYIELLLDIGFFVLFYFLKQLLGLTFITNSLIFYFGFIYVSVHLVNYSIFHTTKNHTNHHFINNKTKRNCNYGPDTLDHLFNSNCDEKFEDLNHIIPNSLISFLLTNYLFDLRLL